MNALLKYVEREKDRFLQELISFLKIPSVSADSKHRKDIRRCANYLAKELRKIGLDNVKIFETGGGPIVYGEWLKVEGKPTVLCYGHYDVQPADPIEEWRNPPFEPKVRGGKIFARGAEDNKGNIFAYLKAVETCLKVKGTLPLNVKFLIEGEEEFGSDSGQEFVKSHQELLEADLVLNSDAGGFTKEGNPIIEHGLRGICCFTLKVIGGTRDLHSGAYGGAVINPIYALARIIDELKGEDGKIKIPGFYDKVQTLSEEDHQELAKLSSEEENLKAESGVPELWGERRFSVLERVWARPTLEINGIDAGYGGEGFKTVIPARAEAKISMRLVPNQDPAEICCLFEEYLKKICPPAVTLEIIREGGLAKPWIISPKTPALQIAARVLKKIFEKSPVFYRCGGTIAIIPIFSETLNAPVVSINFGSPNGNCHAPNENLNLDNFYKGIKCVISFLQEIAKT